MLNDQEQQQSAVDSVDDLLDSLGAPPAVMSAPTATKKTAPPLPAKLKSGDDLLDEADRLLDLLGETAAAPVAAPARSAAVAPTPALDDDLVSLLTSLDTTAATATATSNAIAASKWDKPIVKPSDARLNKTPPAGQYGTLPMPPPAATSNDHDSDATTTTTTTKPKEVSSHYGTLPPTSQRIKATPDSPAAHIPAQLQSF